jgi:hypothetical protein
MYREINHLLFDPTSFDTISQEVETSYFEHCSVYDDYANVKSLFTDSPLDFILNNNSNTFDSSLLPPGLRYHFPGLAIFERPPDYKLISYIDRTVDEIYEYENETDDYPDHDVDALIPIPWQVYVVTYSTHPLSRYELTTVRMYFSNTPLNSPDTSLYLPYLNNFYGNGYLCLPNEGLYGHSKDIKGVMECAYNLVWNSGFNKDLYEAIHQTLNQPLYRTNSLMKEYQQYLRTYNLFGGYSSFYEFLSSKTIEDVVFEPWANPSYFHFSTLDAEHFRSAADRYIHQNNIVINQEYEDEDDDDNEYNLLSQTPYYDLIRDTCSVSKTFCDIINFLLFEKIPYSNEVNTLNHLNKIPQPYNSVDSLADFISRSYDFSFDN